MRETHVSVLHGLMCSLLIQACTAQQRGILFHLKLESKYHLFFSAWQFGFLNRTKGQGYLIKLFGDDQRRENPCVLPLQQFSIMCTSGRK